MSTMNLLYAEKYPITDTISVVIPTVGDVIAHEDDYYSLVTAFTAMPVDMIAQLDEAGFDFSEISEYELFLLLINGVRDIDTSLLLEGVQLSELSPVIDEESKTIVLQDNDGNTVINKMIHLRIANAVRYINFMEKNLQKPANESAKKYMIERAKQKERIRKKKSQKSYFESLIISAVNTEQFKYNFDTVLQLTLYQFNASIRQLMKKVDYDNRMIGVFAGTISAKDMKPEDLMWLADNK